MVLYNGRPHVFYYDSTDDTLRHAYYNGVAWAFEILDGNGGPNGRVVSNVGEYGATILYNGRPHVFYHADALNSLRHAYYNGTTWAFETLDGVNGRINATVGVEQRRTILYNGRPHAFYYDANNGNLRHAYYNGSAWGFETLDGAGGSKRPHQRRRRPVERGASSTTDVPGSSATTTRTGTSVSRTTTVPRGGSRLSTEPAEQTAAFSTALWASSTRAGPLQRAPPRLSDLGHR